MKIQSLIWEEGHVRQADLSMCFVISIAFAEMLILLLCQCLFVLPSHGFVGSIKWFWNGNILCSDPLFVLGLYCWVPSKTLKEKQIHEDRKLSFKGKPCFSIQWYYSKKGFLYAAWNDHNIYTYYVKYIYVYTVNGWIGTVNLVMQLFEKSEC